MTRRATPPIGVLELRSTAGQGGGPERALLLAATAAAAKERETTGGAAAATAPSFGPSFDAPAEVREVLCFLRRRGQEPLQVHRRALELGSSSHLVEERYALEPRTLGRLRRLVREHGIRIVHGHDYKADFYAWLLARLERVVPIATAHGWPVRTLRERFLYYPADRWLLRSFPLVFAVSEDLRRRLVDGRTDSGRVETLPNAVDVEVFRPDPVARAKVRREWGMSDGERVVGSLGRLDPEKRLDLLIEAFAAVAAHRPEARLVVAGSGSHGARLEAEAKRRGLDGRCLVLGHRLDAEDVHRGFDMFVQASDSEGSPYSLLEAMASSTPVIATAVGDAPELVRDGVHGLLVRPGDAQALARAIDQTLASPEDAARRGEAARQRVSAERSLHARQRRMAERYRRLLDPGWSQAAANATVDGAVS